VKFNDPYLPVDTHAHVIEERFPLWPGRCYEPPVATLDDYIGFLDRHGIGRGVLVQPSVYGFDNRCLLDALERADGRLRGIAVPAPDTRAEELEALHRSGVRGVRCNLLYPGGLGLDTVQEWQPVLRELGWRVELQIAIETVPDVRALIERFNVPVVIDHMGSPTPGHCDPSLPRMQQLIALVRAGVCFVKLSAPYRLSAEAPPWRDVIPLAKALLAANAAQCLWGSDWPHLDTTAFVTERDLFAALTEWCSDVESRRLLNAPAAALFAD
jgi:predicted TIM-barrel fold metal-dependent hydrolase